MNQKIIDRLKEIEKKQIHAYNVFCNEMSKTYNMIQKLKKDLESNLI